MTGRKLATFEVIAQDVSEWFSQEYNDNLQNLGKAQVLALQLQHALLHVGNVVKLETNMSKSGLEIAWSLLRSMMVRMYRRQRTTCVIR